MAYNQFGKAFGDVPLSGPTINVGDVTTTTFPGVGNYVGSPIQMPSPSVMPPGGSPGYTGMVQQPMVNTGAVTTATMMTQRTPMAPMQSNPQQQYSASTDKQIMDRLNHVFGKKPVPNYWPLLTYAAVWVIFGIVIFIIFLSAGQTGWGFYYLVNILFMGLIMGIVVWVFCAHGYTTMAWVITVVMLLVAIGFIIWASLAYNQIKGLSRSPFG